MSSLIGTTSIGSECFLLSSLRLDVQMGLTASLAESHRAQDRAGLDFFADLYFDGAAHHIPERVTLLSLGPQGSLDGEWSRDPDQSEVGSGVGTPCPVGA